MCAYVYVVRILLGMGAGRRNGWQGTRLNFQCSATPTPTLAARLTKQLRISDCLQLIAAQPQLIACYACTMRERDGIERERKSGSEWE